MFKIGIGYDIHRLVQGRILYLGGIPIPFQKGLEGHSDADVLLHAIMDALLGAAGLRDIGYYFSPKDARWKGIRSLILLEEVRKKICEEQGYRIGNIDSVIVAEEPVLNPFFDQMKAAMAEILKISPLAITIKATTNEGLNAEGKKEGISAQAVVLLEKNEIDSIHPVGLADTVAKVDVST